MLDAQKNISVKDDQEQKDKTNIKEVKKEIETKTLKPENKKETLVKKSKSIFSKIKTLASKKQKSK